MNYELLFEVTIEDLAKALNIYEVSARELLNGTIKFTKGELAELANYKGISRNTLILVKP